MFALNVQPTHAELIYVVLFSLPKQHIIFKSNYLDLELCGRKNVHQKLDVVNKSFRPLLFTILSRSLWPTSSQMST